MSESTPLGAFARHAIRRLLLLTLISSAIVWIGAEAFYNLQKDEFDRDPRQVELVIPAGTAEQVARGETTTAIPDHMVFIAGDLLVVRNEDSTDHQLGPLWIPANSSAVMPLEKEQNFSLSCSFQSSKYMGLNVRPATDWSVRLQAVLLAGPATAIFLFVYSFLVIPFKPKNAAVTTKPGPSPAFTRPANSENDEPTA